MHNFSRTFKEQPHKRVDPSKPNSEESKELAGEMVMKPQYTLPGLDGFYMTGQWVKGFGLPMAAMSGKEVVRAMCKVDRRKFRAGP